MVRALRSGLSDGTRSGWFFRDSLEGRWKLVSSEMSQVRLVASHLGDYACMRLGLGVGEDDDWWLSSEMTNLL